MASSQKEAKRGPGRQKRRGNHNSHKDCCSAVRHG